MPESYTIGLLMPLLMSNPIHEHESGSSCGWCDSLVTFGKSGEPTRHEHSPECVWMRAITQLGIDPTPFTWGVHVVYVAPPDDPPCEVCGLQLSNDKFGPTFGPDNTGTFAGHEAHQAAAEGLTVLDYREKHRWRPMFETPLVGEGLFAAPMMPLYDFFGDRQVIVDYCPTCYHAAPCGHGH